MNNYNTYNQVGDIKFVPVPSSDPMTALVASAVASTVASIFASLQHPARDARDVIADVQRKIPTMDARNRLATVIAGSKRNFKAADVDVNELLFWYKQNYPNDFKELSAEDKIFWNQYLDNYRQNFLLQRQDLQNQYLDPAYFSNSEISYAPPGTPGSTKASMNMFVTLALVGAGLFLILKKKK